MRLADWHRGSVDSLGSPLLSSRKLLVLVMELPDNSQFKSRAAPPFGRGGDWTEAEKILADTHNELAAYRASKYAGTEHEYQYKVFLSPVERVERFTQEREEIEFQEAAFDELADIFSR